MTDWAADEDGKEYPSGQKILQLDGEEIPFLEIRSLEFSVAEVGYSRSRLTSGNSLMPLREDLLTPIAGDNPSGADLRYDNKLLISQNKGSTPPGR